MKSNSKNSGLTFSKFNFDIGEVTKSKTSFKGIVCSSSVGRRYRAAGGKNE